MRDPLVYLVYDKIKIHKHTVRKLYIGRVSMELLYFCQDSLLDLTMLQRSDYFLPATKILVYIIAP